MKTHSCQEAKFRPATRIQLIPVLNSQLFIHVKMYTYIQGYWADAIIEDFLAKIIRNKHADILLPIWESLHCMLTQL